MQRCYTCNHCGQCDNLDFISTPKSPKCLDCGYEIQPGESFMECAVCGSAHIFSNKEASEEANLNSKNKRVSTF